MRTNKSGLIFAAPDSLQAGFALGQPVLDVILERQYAGCLFRSYRNAGRCLEETWQLHLNGGRPHGPKFEALEDLILWVQDELLEAEEA